MVSATSAPLLPRNFTALRVMVTAMKRATLFLLLLAALNGCNVGDHYHADDPLCYDLAPGRRLFKSELSALEHALEHRLLVDFNDDLSFDNPIGPRTLLRRVVPWRVGNRLRKG